MLTLLLVGLLGVVNRQALAVPILFDSSNAGQVAEASLVGLAEGAQVSSGDRPATPVFASANAHGDGIDEYVESPTNTLWNIVVGYVVHGNSFLAEYVGLHQENTAQRMDCCDLSMDTVL